jgi:hypothetical protein
MKGQGVLAGVLLGLALNVIIFSTMGARLDGGDTGFKTIVAEKVIVRGPGGEVTIDASSVAGIWVTLPTRVPYAKSQGQAALYVSHQEGAVLGLVGRQKAGGKTAWDAALTAQPDGSAKLQGPQGQSLLTTSTASRQCPGGCDGDCDRDCPAGEKCICARGSP